MGLLDRKLSQSYIFEDKSIFEEESARLRLQAQLLFELEFPFLQEHGLQSASNFLDIGCGNGSFLGQIKQAVPRLRVLGIDRAENFLDEARRKNSNCEFGLVDLNHEKSLAACLNSFEPDLIVARYVFQHLSHDEQIHILRSIIENKKPSSRLLLIDTQDDLAEFYPRCEALDDLLKLKGREQLSLGGNRLIGQTLRPLMIEAGFQNTKETLVDFSSLQLGWDAWDSIFWPVIKSSVHEPFTLVEASLLKAGRTWLERAHTENNFRASVKSFYVSGD